MDANPWIKEAITIVIPTIPVRNTMLRRAVASVMDQTLKPDYISISIDNERLGAPRNRDKALERVATEFVAFLDDDDELYPYHLEYLMKAQKETNADLVYPWFDVDLGTDPFPQFEGKPWDDNHVHQVPITFLARTEALRNVGNFSEGFYDNNAVDEFGNRAGEDLHLIRKLVTAGAKIHHLNERTWLWYHHASNTSGLPTRW